MAHIRIWASRDPGLYIAIFRGARGMWAAVET